jgi:N-hydroxyarylamine O-acetyltransferase
VIENTQGRDNGLLPSMESDNHAQMNVSYPTMPMELLDRYLTLLDVPKRKPSFDALCEIVRAHIIRIPFENVSKLYYKKHQGLQGQPNLELFLDGIEQCHFGGTCYANNYYLYQLLANLGYQVKLCGADMSDPDVHLVSMVTVEKQEYLVDVGYAAPFLTPLPRDLTTDYTIALGRDQYVLKPQDTEGRSQMELYRDGDLKHGYLAKPAPRQIQEFEQIIADSYREDSTFMNALLLARFFPDRSVVIRNLTVIESQSMTSKAQTLSSQDELGQVIYQYFAISKKITEDVVRQLGQLSNDSI